MPTDAAVFEPTARKRSGVERRGPLRPRALVSARARRSALMQLEMLKLADRVVLGALALLLAARALPFSVMHLTLDKALPLFAAPVVAGWALRQLGAYRARRSGRLASRLGRLLLGLALGAGAAAGLAAAFRALPAVAYPLGVWAAAAAIGCGGLHFLAWAEFTAWRRNGRLMPNIVVVGATPHADRLIRAALDRRDVHVIGVFDDRLARSPDAVQGVPVLGDVDSLIGHRVLPHVDKIVVALTPSARACDIACKLAVLPNEVALMVDSLDGGREEAAWGRIAGSVAGRRASADDRRRVLAKRVQDLVLSAAALFALSPLLALIAAAVKLDSRGPVFFRQRRHGFNNETIVVWKFRTMRQEATDAAAARQVCAADDRVTRIGGFLRRHSLDELPQLLNVLGGEMSLVGPRPHAIGMRTDGAESAELVAEYAWRHRIKPGLTGWAAVQGSRGPLQTAEDVRRRVALDLEYIDRQSFWLDVWILLKTVPRLLGDRSAVR
jgi:exopolysaccharide biosynthesis polyprenyl glycosylphosphotransferase